MNERDRGLLVLTAALAVLINLVAIDQPLLGDDATLYASIAAGMVRRGDYVGLYAWGQDWLDKPHLPFWLTALSFRIFGITPWAYRLPGVLAIVAAAGYTFRFASRYYGVQAGAWAAVFLLTAEHTILSSADVRAEPYLTLFVIAATWYGARLMEDEHWAGAAIAAGLFVAAALMSKGPFTVIPMAGAVAGQWLVHRRPAIHWRRWAVVAAAALIGITPELAALYLQFDLHPDKVVLGRTGVSGIRFFFWDSQFGRFLGNGPIRRTDGSPLFFVHTLLWVFLPWSASLVLALVRRVRLVRTGAARTVEWYSTAGAGAMFLVFSVSKFQLPYYLNILFPFFAVMTAAEFAARTSPGEVRTVGRVQLGTAVLLVGVGAVLGVLVRPEHAGMVTLGAVALVAAIPLAHRLARDPRVGIVAGTAAASVAVNLYLERGLFPTLNGYDGALRAATWVNRNRPDATVVVAREGQINSFAFGLAREPAYIERVADTALVTTRPYLLLTKADKGRPPEPGTVQSFEHFQVSRPTLRFIDHRTRPDALRRLDLVEVGVPR